jgi:fermentation-respiration switch protein FrsA (DUF1100 family)
MRFSLIVALIGLLAGTALAAPNDLVGDWRGEWIKGGDALPVTMNLSSSDGGLTGMFSSDALQVADIPLGHVEEAGGKVHFEVQGDDGSTVFDGILSGDRLAGAFVDEHTDAHGRFELVRSTHADAPVQTRDVTFNDGAVALSGTLILPATPGRHRAVLFLQGSGPEGRWANRYLAQTFAKAGIAALIYDKRGVGQSTGDWHTAGFDALAQDAAAGVRLLRAQTEVEPHLVGVYGHSQGGTIAPLVDKWAGGLDFIIASAAGGLDPADVEAYSVGNSMGLDRLAPSERADAQAYLRQVVAVAYQGGERATLDAMAAEYKNRTWFFTPPPPESSYWSISRQIAAFRPAQSWRLVNAPVLLVNGGRDERVPPRPSIAAISSALVAGGHPQPTVIFYPEADHLFILPSAAKGGWPKRQPAYAESLIHWVQALH